MRTVSRVAPAAAARAPSLGARRALGANRSASAVRRHRPARRDAWGASARRVVVATRAFFSSDESGSLDDYEFDAGVREAYRTRRAFERAEWHAQEPREKEGPARSGRRGGGMDNRHDGVRDWHLP